MSKQNYWDLIEQTVAISFMMLIVVTMVCAVLS